MRVILVAAILFITLSANTFSKEEKLACEKFRTGKFIMDEDPDILILRSEHFQIEWDKKKESVSWYRITWLDKCTYKARLIKTDNDNEVLFQDLTLKFDITNTTVDAYTFNVEIVGANVSDRGEVKKVGDL